MFLEMVMDDNFIRGQRAAARMRRLHRFADHNEHGNHMICWQVDQLGHGVKVEAVEVERTDVRTAAQEASHPVVK